MYRLKNWSFSLVLLMTLFVACNKEATDTSELNTAIQESTTELSGEQGVPTLTTIRALAAAAQSSNRSGNGPDEENPCGCYDVFEGIDFDATDEVIDAAVDSVLAELPEEELSRLFDPVCTPDGEIYESACIADCEGITGYTICTDEQLDDHLFGEFDCGDLDSLSFPLDLELPDGTVVTVNSEEEFFEVLDQWYEAYEEEYEDYEECYTIVYPVTITYPDGTTGTYNSDDELDTALDAWWEANDDSDDYPMPVFPITVQLDDESIITIENYEQLEELEEECYGDYEEDHCFELVFPMTVNQTDGTISTVNDEDELYDLLDELVPLEIEEEEAEELILSMLLPFDILLEDGTQQTITSIEELDAVLEACYDDYGLTSSESRGKQNRWRNNQSVPNIF